TSPCTSPTGSAATGSTNRRRAAPSTSPTRSTARSSTRSTRTSPSPTTSTSGEPGPVGFRRAPAGGLRGCSARGAGGGAAVGAGVRGNEASGRGEAALEYLLSPRAAGRLGVYLGGGLAGVVGAGNGGFLLAYLGVERSPGLPSGWAVEAGLGSGYRVRVAW